MSIVAVTPTVAFEISLNLSALRPWDVVSQYVLVETVIKLSKSA